MYNRCDAYDENRDTFVRYCNDNQNKEYKAQKSNRILLKCGTSGGVVIPGLLTGEPVETVDAAALPFLFNTGTGFNVASVNIDTREFSDPAIKLEFASNISINADLIIPDAIFTLNFQIFKQCGKQLVPIPVGPIWTYSNLLVIGGQSDTFTFFVCDQPCKKECCNYIAVVTFGLGTDATLFAGQLSITNATLTATVADGSCNC